jgi:N-acetylglucosaminyldiphosphoundecaprenol N-acetyl-beta-D-mannosaminyltransferase
MAEIVRLFPRARFLRFPLDYIPSMDALMSTFLRCIDERSLCSVMGISGPIVASGDSQPELVADLDRFSVIVPDGRGIELFAPLLRVPCGPTLPLPRVAEAALALAHEKHLAVFVLGATADVNEQAQRNLLSRYPGLRITGRDGYFQPEEEGSVAEEIRAAAPDIMLAAMPTPKKERFILEWQEGIEVPVAIGCGGYIDAVAGVTKLPPEWATRLALSWLVRVVQEPRRLWRRIFVANLKFAGMVLRRAVRGGP